MVNEDPERRSPGLDQWYRDLIARVDLTPQQEQVLRLIGPERSTSAQGSTTVNTHQD